jgi:hypothetical protein
MEHAARPAIMRIRLPSALVTLPLFVACATTSGGDEGPTPFDDENDPSPGDINAGAPANDSLPDDNKADAVYPAAFEVKFQSPVKSQGSRGVCSMFAATALMENLYIKAGMGVADADFSEQYMQWATKNLTHSFPNTEGSTSNDNLRMVVQFGGIKEAEWPYESFPWTAANDPACNGGQNLPTKCYTNGEPPASVNQATKFKLPATRWLNTGSLKAHLTGKGTGVNIGLDFFYQAWNHRRSTLPVDTALWQEGVVTFPNADDVTESHMHRAGHAIQIVGWDDDKEVTMRDKEGKPVLDASGNPKKEKGFWIFKNSWGTAGFGINHPTGAGYGWLSYKYVSQYGSAVTAELPDLGGGGPGPGPGGGMTPRTYNAAPNASIPDASATGASSTIAVTDTGTVSEVKVTVDIAHTYIGDLKITLTHGGVTKVVVDQAGGSTQNLMKTFTVTGFSGAANAGDWTIKVEDKAAQDVGTLKSWVLETKS